MMVGFLPFSSEDSRFLDVGLNTHDHTFKIALT